MPATPAPEPERGRRTQEERSAAMRLRLLDATVECLVAYGYAGTTTTRVAAAAGVTRGAQVHHFPTKADLVTSAVSHLAAKRTEAAFAELGRLRRSPDPIGDGLDLLWEMHQGDVFSATVELWVAARTDPELAEHMSRVEPIVSSSLLEFGRALLPDRAPHPEFQHLLYTAMDIVRGILIAGWGSQGGQETQARWERAKGNLRTLFGAVMGGDGQGAG